MEKPGSSHALVLFKHFLAERWFGGPEFDTWVLQYPDLEGELRRSAATCTSCSSAGRGG